MNFFTSAMMLLSQMSARMSRATIMMLIVPILPTNLSRKRFTSLPHSQPQLNGVRIWILRYPVSRVVAIIAMIVAKVVLKKLNRFM